MNRAFRGIQEESIRELFTYDWPGNVRELENLLEQAVFLSNGAGRTRFSGSASLRSFVKRKAGFWVKTGLPNS